MVSDGFLLRNLGLGEYSSIRDILIRARKIPGPKFWTRRMGSECQMGNATVYRLQVYELSKIG